ncbi:MAG: SDR family oxidoreductase, partial [Chloroflexi bacterium]|nr:SDR family oxidoreductase [Chloroflexota bacterium]
AVNLRGSYFTAQAAARQMRAQGGGGRIIFSSSITGAQAVAYVSAYAMCKAALRMLARNLVAELSPHRITVNALLIGATVTPRNLRDDPDYDEHWGAVIPLGRAAQPDDVASAALFLCSNSGAFITGATLAVDGGWSCVSPTPELKFVQQHEAARQQ